MNLERIALSMLLEIARRDNAPIVAALVHRVEADRELIGEMAGELDQLDSLATWMQNVGSCEQPSAGTPTDSNLIATCKYCGYVKHEKTFQRDRCPRCNRNNCWIGAEDPLPQTIDQLAPIDARD